MDYKKLLILTFSLVLIFSFNVKATEDGENDFELKWSSQKIAFPDGIPNTSWDCRVLPDFNENGRRELFIAADDPAVGAWYFVVEATENDQYEVVWYYYIQECVYSYVLAFTTPDADIDGDGLPELIAGVAQDAGTGQPGVWIWEKDTTFEKDANGSYINYPFSMDAPTCTYDVNGNAGSITCVFAAQLDADPNTELVIGETHDDMIYVVEETGGDLAFPVFEVEYTDDFVYSPWGYFYGDIDNDGQPDFGVGSSDFNSIRVYENTGVEDDYVKHFEMHMDNDVDGYCLRGLGARDINNDGLGEIIYVRYTSPGKVFIVTNPGEIALMDSTNIHEIYVDPDGRITGVAYGDMDHGFASDGPDIYFAARDGQKVYDMEYTGPRGEGVDPEAPGDPANWDTYTIYSKAQRMQKVAASDFDRDGEGEVAIIYAGGSDENYLEFIEHKTLPDAGFTVMWHDDPDTDLTVDPVHGNPRGIWAGSDVDQDGNKEIMCTEYNGMFHVYEVTGNNTVEWVYSYKDPHAPASGAQPRDIKVGDVDGNGLQEIVAHMGGTDLSAHPDSLGFYFFEWDGSTDNGYGIEGGPTYILPDLEIDPRLTASNRTESIWLEDIDQDGNQEVLFPSDASGTSGDGFYIFSCVDGELTGFPTWLVEVAQHRASGEMTGSPKGARSSDVDGDGHREAIFTSWNNGQMTFFEAVEPDSFEETTVFTDPRMRDDVIYKGIGVVDLDGDGDDEIVFDIYDWTSIFIINSPPDLKDLDLTNPAHFATLRDRVGGTGLTGGVGDQDQDGLPEFIYPIYTRGAVRQIEYIGGGADIMASESYTTQEIFNDRDFVYGQYYNNGVITAVHGSYGIMVPKEDLDGDGNKEIVVTMIESPYSNTWLYVFEYVGTSVRGEYWRVITPNDYKLVQNYPNPFNATTKIEYYIPLNKKVTLKVYNSLGQEVKTLVNNKAQVAGYHSVEWNGTDNNGHVVSSGMYIYSLEIGNVKLTKTMTLLK